MQEVDNTTVICVDVVVFSYVQLVDVVVKKFHKWK